MQPLESWRPLFVGQRNGTTLKFICFNTGSYAVVQEERILFRGDGADALPTVLDRFLSMIDRPIGASAPGNTAARRRMLCVG